MSMEGPLEERDWKYMRRIHDEMLHVLCRRINYKAAEIAGREFGNPHEHYLELFTHVRESDKIVADCFNDWRRSNIHRKIRALREHDL
ncbi:MAG: hypothetical protein RRA94_16495, partial [Bacteroidota bacterium]|nr:hypothetical protein [Bacteroidota bacterium]